MKLKVETYDEVCHPKVLIGRAKEASIVDMATSVNAESVVNSTLTQPDVVEQKTVDAESSELTVLVDVIKNETDSKRRRRGRKMWYSRIGTVLVGVVAICAVVLVGLRIAGFRTFTIMSGSMEPEYPVGAMVYVKPVDYQSLEVGDVISFVANDEKTVVTHRIVDIEIDETDATVRRFKTKGDANSSVDSGLVHYRNVLGTPIITIPLIGYFAHNIQQPPGIYIALVVGTLLLAWTFLPGTLEERRKTARKSVA